jgi:hypothetical protein
MNPFPCVSPWCSDYLDLQHILRVWKIEGQNAQAEVEKTDSSNAGANVELVVHICPLEDNNDQATSPVRL